jgi:hypothetical protein
MQAAEQMHSSPLGSQSIKRAISYPRIPGVLAYAGVTIVRWMSMMIPDFLPVCRAIFPNKFVCSRISHPLETGQARKGWDYFVVVFFPAKGALRILQALMFILRPGIQTAVCAFLCTPDVSPSPGGGAPVGCRKYLFIYLCHSIARLCLS